MGCALWILFVCGRVVGLQGLYKCVLGSAFERKNMAEVARTRAYYSRMLGSNAGNRSSSTERSRERRRRRIEMRRNSGLVAAADGDLLPSGQEDGGGVVEDDKSEHGGSTVVGIPVPAASCFSWAPGNGGLVIRESTDRGVSSAPAGGQLLMPVAPARRNAAVPVVGAVAVAGRQRQMEDAVAIQTNLCSPAINRCRPVHYFGVFDGHGGSHVLI